MDRADEFGRITVSSVLFNPIIPADRDSNLLLDYGNLLKEEKILTDLVRSQSFGRTRLEADLVRTAIQASIAESGLSPTDLSAPEQAQLAGAVTQKLNAILAPSGGNFSLPPGQVISLIAAYKTQMVALQDYYNLPEITALTGSLSDLTKSENDWGWLPYRASMTVVVDPGLFARLDAYDAVIDIKLGGDHNAGKIKVLHVVPAEQAESFSELDAQLQQFSSLLSVGGALQNANLNASIERINAIADRLEGQRSHPTVTVSYLSEQEISVRFRPGLAAAAKGSGRDLRPRPITLTATVLIKRLVQKNELGQPSKVVFGSGSTPFHIPELYIRQADQESAQDKREAQPENIGCPVLTNAYLVPAANFQDGRTRVPLKRHLPWYRHRFDLNPETPECRRWSLRQCQPRATVKCDSPEYSVLPGYPVTFPERATVSQATGTYIPDPDGNKKPGTARVFLRLNDGFSAVNRDGALSRTSDIYKIAEIEPVSDGCWCTLQEGEEIPNLFEGGVLKFSGLVPPEPGKARTFQFAVVFQAKVPVDSAPEPFNVQKQRAIDAGIRAPVETFSLLHTVTLHPPGKAPVSVTTKPKTPTPSLSITIGKDKTDIKLTETPLNQVDPKLISAILPAAVPATQPQVDLNLNIHHQSSAPPADSPAP